MKKVENCVFCKIVAGEIPSSKVYEDENVFGVLTIRPHVKGHILLIPKKHSEELVFMDDETYTKLFYVVKKQAEKIKKIFNAPRVSILTMGFGVAHTHVHVLPITKETDLDSHMAYEATKEELTEVVELFNK